MKNNYIFILTGIALLLASCGGKEEPVKTEAPVEDTVVLEALIEKPVEEVIVEELPAQPKIIIVKRGEWLYDIARAQYGDFHDWKKIFEANKDKILDPNIIHPGMELVLPD